MERVSGWYKRRSQIILMVLAVAVTVGFNVSTLRLVDRLWNDSVVRDSVATAAVQATQQSGQQEGNGGPADTQNAGANSQAAGGGAVNPNDQNSPVVGAKEAGKKVKAATEDLAALNLPIGWGKDNRNWLSFLGLVGWLLTAVAVWFGAPFWFDALSRLAPLRSTGRPPPAAKSGDGSSGR